MRLDILTQIEEQISQLSFDEQLWLIERLAQQLRKGQDAKEDTTEVDLSAMAFDPQIQHELQAIENEFAFTEADGLEKL